MPDLTDNLRAEWLTLAPYAARFATALAVVVAAAVLGRVVGNAAAAGLARADLSATHRNFFRALAHGFCVVLGVVIALDILGLDAALTAFIASSGAIAIIAGFAFREIGENLLAGLFLAFSRPFDVGDWIASEDAEGEVREIELRYTHIRSADARDIYIPNAQLFNRTLVNFTRDGLRRPEFTVGIAYEDDVDRARQLLAGVLADVPGVLAAPAPTVGISALAPNYVELRAHFWLDTFAIAKGSASNTIEQQEFVNRTRSAAMERCRVALLGGGFTVSANVSTGIVLQGREG